MRGRFAFSFVSHRAPLRRDVAAAVAAAPPAPRPGSAAAAVAAALRDHGVRGAGLLVPPLRSGVAAPAGGCGGSFNSEHQPSC
jgi:hypothetical protein